MRHEIAMRWAAVAVSLAAILILAGLAFYLYSGESEIVVYLQQHFAVSLVFLPITGIAAITLYLIKKVFEPLA